MINIIAFHVVIVDIWWSTLFSVIDDVKDIILGSFSDKILALVVNVCMFRIDVLIPGEYSSLQYQGCLLMHAIVN